jgi:sporulation protein YlmC with PRC-barrel domain
MKRKLWNVLACLSATALLGAGTLLAQANDAAGAKPAADTAADTAAEGTPKIKGPHGYRVDQVRGLPVKNRQGEELGEVEDVVIDLQNGTVRYAAMSFGGFLGVGDKLFAVPWMATTLKYEDGEPFIVVDATKEKLEKATGFNKDAWPDFGSEKFSRELDTLYGVKRDAQAAANRVQRNVENAAQPKATDAPATNAPKTEEAVATNVYRSQDVVGLTVRNKEGAELGEIENIVVDMASEKVMYFALSFDPTVAAEEKLFAIPVREFRVQKNEDGAYLVLNVEKERLKNAPGFSEDAWPNTSDPNWSKEIDEFYKTNEPPRDTDS